VAAAPIGVVGRVRPPGMTAGDGIGIGTCPDEGLGMTGTGIMWPGGGIVGAPSPPGPMKGVEPAGAGLGMGMGVPWGMTGGPCCVISGLGMRI
jgi:hypothetical protein